MHTIEACLVQNPTTAASSTDASLPHGLFPCRPLEMEAAYTPPGAWPSDLDHVIHHDMQLVHQPRHTHPGSPSGLLSWILSSIGSISTWLTASSTAPTSHLEQDPDSLRPSSRAQSPGHSTLENGFVQAPQPGSREFYKNTHGDDGDSIEEDNLNLPHFSRLKFESEPQYDNLQDFFTHDESFGIPGLSLRQPLIPRHDKSQELRKLTVVRAQEKARLRREQALKEQNDRLAPLGLRVPNGTVLRDLSGHWQSASKTLHIQGKAKVNPPEPVELSGHDFKTLLPRTAWLNDNIVQAALVSLAQSINNAAGVKVTKDNPVPPKCVAISPLWYTSTLVPKGPKNHERRFKRTWNMTPDNFLDIDTFLVPINHGNHWTIVIVRPSRRLISYVDSFHGKGEMHRNRVHDFVRTFTGSRYKEEEWRAIEYLVPRQTNGYDCGMFVITNAIYVALGLDPNSYDADDMWPMRSYIACMLAHGGFHGEFDLTHL